VTAAEGTADRVHGGGLPHAPGALRFDIGHALPAPLVEKLIAVRLQQAFPD
jgi:hypothetical protein